MKTASWMLIAFVGVAALVLSAVATVRAYGSYADNFGGQSLAELTAGRPDVETALRSRRATAAAYSAGFAALSLLITVGPYRRGDVWAWWALLLGTLLVTGLLLLRVPLLGTGLSGSTGGGAASGALIQLALVGTGLALGAGRLRIRPGGNAASTGSATEGS